MLLLLLVGGLVACNNEAASDVDESVETAFELEYPDATKASWRADKANGYYDVVFTEKGNNLTARYDRNGKRVRTDEATDDYDRRNARATATTTNTTTTTTRNRQFSEYNREAQTGLSRIGFKSDVPMLETEGDVKELSTAVSNQVAKDYEGWTIHKVKHIEQEGRKLVKLELKSEALDKEVKPMYTLTGELVGIDD